MSFISIPFGSRADWITEASTMIVKGQAAKDLYSSLNAQDRIDPLSTSNDQFRTKKTKIAECSASFYRFETAEGDFDWIIQDNAKCKIKAPRGTVINQ